MSTAGQWQVTATLDGVPLGEFETKSGGAVSAELTKRRPGGMSAEKVYAGQPTAGDVVIARVYERERDHDLVRLCYGRAGKGVVTISEQALDDNGVPWGRPTTWVGRLGNVEPSEANANSNDVRTFELTAVVGLPA
jgi:hypothetical protein